MKLFKYSLIALISISLFSCEKDDDNNTGPITPVQTNTENLCGKNFVISNFTFKVNGATILSGLDTSFYPLCEQDDIIRFETNGIVTIKDGANICDAADPLNETSTWAFYDSETKIIFEPGPDADTNDIITNDGTVLTLGSREIEMGDTKEYIMTYRAQ
jgi:hypothetical protein